jgi:hypothetical protein
MALSDDDLRILIFLRSEAASESCNSYHINRVEGQIQGLLAALIGKYPGVLSTVDDVFTAAGIPFSKDGNFITYDDEWLTKMGFEFDDEDVHGHPKFPNHW